jgi:hypothetical protein
MKITGTQIFGAAPSGLAEIWSASTTRWLRAVLHQQLWIHRRCLGGHIGSDDNVYRARARGGDGGSGNGNSAQTSP